MTKLFYDTETCGLHGLAVLIQYAEEDGPVTMHSIWTEQVIDTLKLIEWMMEHEVIGFNLAYDHFHLSKIYSIWSLVADPHVYPEDIIDEIAALEPLGRDGMCLKPRAACDVMLHARKGKYQSTMDRKDIRIRKIPTAIAWDVAEYLEENVKLSDIYFARRKDKNAPHWAVFDRDDGSEFKDIVLKFKASAALKNLAIHALGKDPNTVLRYGAIEPTTFPVEVGYAPYALAISKAPHWRAKVKKGSGYRRGYTWPAIIRDHISHWNSNKLARTYAQDDVIYTRELYEHLGSPEPGDNDSELACMVGASRWKGYTVDIEKLKELRRQTIIKAESAPKSPNAVKNYISEVMTADEKTIFEIVSEGSTKKTILEEIANTWVDENAIPTDAAKRAKEVLDARQAKSEIDLLDKLIIAGRFHASFAIIGALSGRMSGSGGDLNAQGIKREKYIRECFPLAASGLVICGGDFDSFEVVLAIAHYGDKKLEAEVLSGKKIHALFGMHVYPNMTYEQILADKEKYTRSKSAVFAMIYGGEAFTLKTRLGVPLETAEKAYQLFIKEYPDVGKGRRRVFDMFCSMRQPKGIGTAVEWHEPSDYIETMFGFRRYFTLENQICKALFNLARRPPEQWKQYKGKVIRRDREQNIVGACSSALYAAAFGIQAANMRAAGNHVIQGSGAQITKQVQRKVWDLQPCGVNTWVVQPMNIHDEIMCPTVVGKINEVRDIVNSAVESFRTEVPLIKMEWHSSLQTWADK